MTAKSFAEKLMVSPALFLMHNYFVKLLSCTAIKSVRSVLLPYYRYETALYRYINTFYDCKVLLIRYTLTSAIIIVVLQSHSHTNVMQWLSPLS